MEEVDAAAWNVGIADVGGDEVGESAEGLVSVRGGENRGVEQRPCDLPVLIGEDVGIEPKGLNAQTVDADARVVVKGDAEGDLVSPLEGIERIGRRDLCDGSRERERGAGESDRDDECAEEKQEDGEER